MPLAGSGAGSSCHCRSCAEAYVYCGPEIAPPPPVLAFYWRGAARTIVPDAAEPSHTPSASSGLRR
jgi:hypothetical protein